MFPHTRQRQRSTFRSPSWPKNVTLDRFHARVRRSTFDVSVTVGVFQAC